jgi:hypothetical protein
MLGKNLKRNGQRKFYDVGQTVCTIVTCWKAASIIGNPHFTGIAQVGTD